ILSGPSRRMIREARSVLDEATHSCAQRPRIGVVREVWVSRDERRLAWARRRVTEMWRHYAAWIGADESQSPAAAPDTRAETHWLAARDALANKLAATAVVGRPEEVVDSLAPLVEDGADMLTLRAAFDGVGGRELDENLELLATDVVPV